MDLQPDMPSVPATVYGLWVTPETASPPVFGKERTYRRNGQGAGEPLSLFALSNNYASFPSTKFGSLWTFQWVTGGKVPPLFHRDSLPC